MGVFARAVLKVPGMRPLVAGLSRWYRREVEAELRKYGLRYDDLIIEHGKLRCVRASVYI